MNHIFRLLPFALLAPSLFAQTTINFCVGTTPPGTPCAATFPQIFDAVNAAALLSPAGSLTVITVGPGTYAPFSIGTAFQNKSLKITGSDVLNPPVVDGGGLSRCVAVFSAGPNIEIEVLKVINGMAPAADPRGGGVAITNTPARLFRVEADQCIAFDAATGTGQGGGFYSSDATGVTLTSCEARNCISGFGGGFFVTGPASPLSKPVLDACLAEGCDAVDTGTLTSGGGGGYAAACCSATFDSCVARDNDADRFGGGFFLDTGAATDPTEMRMIDCEVRENRCPIQPGGAGMGGGIHISGSLDEDGDRMVADLNRVLVIDNVADLGGGLWIGNGATTTIDYLHCMSNDASTGGGLFFDGMDAPLDVTNSTFAQNNALEAPGPLGGVGGGAVVDGSLHPSQTVRWRNVLFVGNDAYSDAGAMFLKGISEPFADLLVQTCTIANNTSQIFRPGIVCLQCPSSVVDSCIAQGNTGALLLGTPNLIQVFGVATVQYSNVVGPAGVAISGATLQQFNLNPPVVQSFATGPGVLPYQPVTNFYLQTTSACIDVGNPAIALAPPPYGTATTQVSHAADAIRVDMGFHYNGLEVPPLLSTLTTDAQPTVTWPDQTIYQFTLTYTAAPAGADMTMLVFAGSQAGTSPPTPLPPIHVPLVYDAYSALLANQPTVFSSTQPTIQFPTGLAGGTATFAWTIKGIVQDPGPFTVSHACFVMDRIAGVWTPRTPSLPLTITVL